MPVSRTRLTSLERSDSSGWRVKSAALAHISICVQIESVEYHAHGRAARATPHATDTTVGQK
jgi:hypothetical protein